MSGQAHRFIIRGTQTLIALIALVVLVTLPFTTYATPANKHGIAVIIGNSVYQGRTPAVDFAYVDADAFQRYVIDVLGYDPENVIDLRDATKAQIETVFGNSETHEGKLWRYVDPKGRSDVTVFYSGHGVPGLKDKRGYLLPVNADPETPEINGFAVDTLLANLGKLQTRSVSVFLDTCFSGDSQKGVLVQGISGLTIAPKMPQSASKITVVTAAQSDQVASWDFEAKHGMFTEHLLSALYGEADKAEYGNQDGNVSLEEVQGYLDDNLTRAARKEYGRHQNAWVSGNAQTVMSKPGPGLVRPVIKVSLPAPAAAAIKKAVIVVKKPPNFNGSWVPDTKLILDNTCPAGEFLMEKFVVEDGEVTGMVGHSQDGPFRFNARIDKDGSVSYYTQGQYVMVVGSGKFTDDRGIGSFEVSGEVSCDGRWELVREK